MLDVITYYEQARQAGMKPLPSDAMRTLRAWVKRALPAYWTHSGYMNWDTGLYLQRWHLTRYWAWSCQGLLALATAHDFCSDEERGWAKHVFDRALGLYVRLCERRGPDSREPGSTMFGVRTTFSEAPHFELARFQALAAEALMRGLGRRESSEPPPMYAFDPVDRATDDHDAGLQHGDRRGQQRRLPLRRHRAGTAVRRATERDRPHRRQGAGRDRRRRAQRRRCDRRQLAAPARSARSHGLPWC